MRNIIYGFGLVVLTAGWLGFLCWLLSGCSPVEQQTGACSPSDYAARVGAVYASHVEECSHYDNDEQCPGYWAAKSEVAKLHEEFVQCR